MKNKRSKIYRIDLEEVNGEFKVRDARRLKRVNQHVEFFQQINSRGLARRLNNGKLIIN